MILYTWIAIEKKKQWTSTGAWRSFSIGSQGAFYTSREGSDNKKITIGILNTSIKESRDLKHCAIKYLY
jgi:hypothetical protein